MVFAVQVILLALSGNMFGPTGGKVFRKVYRHGRVYLLKGTTFSFKEPTQGLLLIRPQSYGKHRGRLTFGKGGRRGIAELLEQFLKSVAFRRLLSR
jgi:hypothetical protein